MREKQIEEKSVRITGEKTRGEGKGKGAVYESEGDAGACHLQGGGVKRGLGKGGRS